MLTNDALTELLAASRQGQQVSQRDAIKQGRTVWYRGKAAPAEDGAVALDTTTGGRIIIDEKDVRSVAKDPCSGEDSGSAIFLVEVASEANVIVRFEAVSKADPGDCKCSEEKRSDTPDTIASLHCSGGITWHCTWYVGVNGWPLRICYPVWDKCADWFYIPTVNIRY